MTAERKLYAWSATVDPNVSPITVMAWKAEEWDDGSLSLVGADGVTVAYFRAPLAVVRYAEYRDNGDGSYTEVSP